MDTRIGIRLTKCAKTLQSLHLRNHENRQNSPKTIYTNCDAINKGGVIIQYGILLS